jgi:hypothetical protein
MTFIRDVRRKLKYKRVRFETAVLVFIYERMQSLTLNLIDGNDKKQEQQLVHQERNERTRKLRAITAYIGRKSTLHVGRSRTMPREHHSRAAVHQ